MHTKTLEIVRESLERLSDAAEPELLWAAVGRGERLLTTSTDAALSAQLERELDAARSNAARNEEVVEEALFSFCDASEDVVERCLKGWGIEPLELLSLMLAADDAACALESLGVALPSDVVNEVSVYVRANLLVAGAIAPHATRFLGRTPPKDDQWRRIWEAIAGAKSR